MLQNIHRIRIGLMTATVGSCSLFVGSYAADVMFQPGNGDRPNVPNYLVILTDGNSDNATLTWNEAMRARALSINIITVCIFEYFSVFCISVCHSHYAVTSSLFEILCVYIRM